MYIILCFIAFKIFKQHEIYTYKFKQNWLFCIFKLKWINAIYVFLLYTLKLEIMSNFITPNKSNCNREWVSHWCGYDELSNRIYDVLRGLLYRSARCIVLFLFLITPFVCILFLCQLICTFNTIIKYSIYVCAPATLFFSRFVSVICCYATSKKIVLVFIVLMHTKKNTITSWKSKAGYR